MNAADAAGEHGVDGTPDATPPAVPIEPIDVLLGEGEPQALAGWRQRIASDPEAMLDMADTVALIEGLRQLRTDASAGLCGRLGAVVQRSERRVPPIVPGDRSGPWWAAAAAAATLALLSLVDPLGQRARSTGDTGNALPVTPQPVPAGPSAASEARAVAWQSAVEQMRARLGLLPSDNLREAFEAGLDDRRDELGRWLDPRNALVMMRLDHELRANALVRREAARRQGGLPDADERVQQLADAIAEQLPGHLLLSRAEDVPAVGRAVRALIAAGPRRGLRDAALRSGGDWLSRRAPAATGMELVTVLAALVETAAVTGDHVDVAAQHGLRLLDEVLQPDDHNWSRRLPDLLGPRVSAAVLADAGRLFAFLPGLGANAERCGIVRRLLLGRLRDRRDAGEDSPELVAAMLFGSADLLAEAERDALELRLRRWQPGCVAPDYCTVHLLAWALEPGRRGFTRWQAELRLLAVKPDPEALNDRAAFCLCLATNYAAFRDGLLRRVAASI